MADIQLHAARDPDGCGIAAKMVLDDNLATFMLSFSILLSFRQHSSVGFNFIWLPYRDMHFSKYLRTYTDALLLALHNQLNIDLWGTLMKG